MYSQVCPRISRQHPKIALLFSTVENSNVLPWPGSHNIFCVWTLRGGDSGPSQMMRVQLKGEDATKERHLCGSQLLLLRPRLPSNHHHLCPLLKDDQHIPRWFHNCSTQRYNNHTYDHSTKYNLGASNYTAFRSNKNHTNNASINSRNDYHDRGSYNEPNRHHHKHNRTDIH